MNFRLINIIGIDGAGKTTLAKALVANLRRRDDDVRYKYCQYFAKLLYPVKLAARVSVMRRTDEFKDYSGYNSVKQGTSSRFPRLAGLYAGIWLVDYMLQVFIKVAWPLMLGKKLVVDRYIYDIAVNISLTANRDLAYAEKLVAVFYRFMPRPDFIIFIDLPDAVAFSRKNDIQDVAYLQERSERYRALAQKNNFHTIDGTKMPEQMLDDARRIVTAHGR